MLIHAGVPASVSSEQSKTLSNQTGRPLALALAVSETATSSLGLVTGPKGSCSGTSIVLLEPELCKTCEVESDVQYRERICGREAAGAKTKTEEIQPVYVRT